MFLPPEADEAKWCIEQLEAIVAEEGQQLLGWRDVPLDDHHLGWIARDVQPGMKQIFVARGAETAADMFEWKLYVSRKRIENAVVQSRCGKMP